MAIKNKLGELTTQQIVMLVVLIVSFAVILIFLFFLDLGKTTDDDICHNSVVLRANSVVSVDTVPLRCKTENTCFSGDKTCESMTNPKVVQVDKETDVYEKLADRMANCWWMFGEGKLNYVGTDKNPGLYCSLCNFVEFDDSALKVIPSGKVDQEKLYDYMATKKMPGKKFTYAEYLYGTNDLSFLTESDTGALEYGKLDMGKQYYIMTAMDSDLDTAFWGGVIALGIDLIPVARAIPIPKGQLAGAVLSAIKPKQLIKYIGDFGKGAGIGYFVGTLGVGKSGESYIGPTIVEANSEVFKALL